MAKSAKSKFSISVDPEVDDFLQRFAHTFGSSRSAVINGLIKQSMPHLEILLSETQEFLLKIEPGAPITEEQKKEFIDGLFKNVLGMDIYDV